mmetsp:Transcript_12537/g.27442  ORF Transcript_12537/g.27442 Transcript_12537/m.27442 type:complete len:520 (+) Transcript_12537:260-1819(+)
MKLYLSLSHIILVASTSWYTTSDAASSTATSSGGSIRGNSSKDGDRKLSLFADYTPHKKRSIERDADNGEGNSMNIDTIVPSTAAGIMETRIIGGSQTQNGRYSYAVSLQDSLGHFCGGSLIAKDVVLTAAHCQGGSYNVVVGRHDLTTNSGDSIPVKKEIPHPKYNDRTTDSDWNIVILSRPTTENVDLVQINSSGNSPSTGQDVTVMGWGDTIAADDAQKLSDVLMAVDVNVISNSDCDDSSGTINGWSDSYKGQITSNMLCAADKIQDSCQGDSGGPLIIPGNGASSDVQVGVVSWGIGCASANFPGVYARVSEAYDWIKQTVCSQSSDPPVALCGGGNNNNPPSPSPPSPSPPSPSPPSPTPNSGNWRTILNEDFTNGYGSFKSGGQGARHYGSSKSRQGVIRIQNGKGSRSSFYSKDATLDGSYSKFKVTFSFYALGMENNDSFCLDYSTNGGSSWKGVDCWSGPNDYQNKIWYDDTVVTFSDNRASELSVRFRCQGNSNQDDVLFDKVKVEGQ